MYHSLLIVAAKYPSVQWRTGLLKRRRMCSPPHPKGEKERGCNILVQAGRRRRTKVVIHVLCVLRALKRTQNTQNMYYNFRSPKATRLSDVTEKTVLVPLLHTLSILVHTHISVVFIDQDGYVPSHIGILIDQHLYRHRR